MSTRRLTLAGIDSRVRAGETVELTYEEFRRLMTAKRINTYDRNISWNIDQRGDGTVIIKESSSGSA